MTLLYHYFSSNTRILRKDSIQSAANKDRKPVPSMITTKFVIFNNKEIIVLAIGIQQHKQALKVAEILAM